MTYPKITKTQVNGLRAIEQHGVLGPSPELRFTTALALRNLGLVDIEGGMHTIYVRERFGRGSRKSREEYHWVARLNDTGRRFIASLRSSSIQDPGSPRRDPSKSKVQIGPVTIFNRDEACQCGCKGQDPWHQWTYKRVITLDPNSATTGTVRMPYSTKPVGVYLTPFGIWNIDKSSIVYDK
jgi:hypothetical protein